MTTFKRLKTITSYAGHARFLAGCDGYDRLDDDPDAMTAGYLARVQREDVPSPYAYSPTTPLLRWNGRKVFISEVSHRRFEVFEVPANMLTFQDQQKAEDWHMRFRRKTAA